MTLYIFYALRPFTSSIFSSRAVIFLVFNFFCIYSVVKLVVLPATFSCIFFASRTPLHLIVEFFSFVFVRFLFLYVAFPLPLGSCSEITRLFPTAIENAWQSACGRGAWPAFSFLFMFFRFIQLFIVYIRIVCRVGKMK